MYTIAFHSEPYSITRSLKETNTPLKSVPEVGTM